MTEPEMANALAAVRTTTDIGALSDADFIIEAATENLALKQKILKELESITQPACIIATNTSSVSITKLAATLLRQIVSLGCIFSIRSPSWP
jgi:3-hydroxybutyryl-CoA dehydrogenase